MRKNFLSRFAVLAVCTCILCVSVFYQPSRANAAQPNIILINMDDMGWGDFKTSNTTACGVADATGTPCLQKLASEGVTLSNFYTPSPLCTPSRAALMTGLDPRRTSTTLSLSNTMHLPLKDQSTNYINTLADVLKAAGYNTAIVGKWNLGWGGEEIVGGTQRSLDSWGRGFEYNYVLPLGIGQNHKGFCLVTKGTTSTDSTEPSWYYIKGVLSNGYEQYDDPGAEGTADDIYIEKCKPQSAQGTAQEFPGFWAFSQKQYPTETSGGGDAYSLTRVLTERAKDYIKIITTEATTKSRPFFLYLAYPTPHIPLHIHLKQSQLITTTDSSLITAGTYTPQNVIEACELKAKNEAQCDGAGGIADCKNSKAYLTSRQKCEVNVLYPDVIKGIDFNVGLLLNEICGDANKDGICEGSLYDNTIIIFTSDNGPYMGDAAEYPDRGSTGGLRGGKKFTYEGGVRVPFIARWPSMWPVSGNPNTSLQLADMRDIFPTLVREALCPDRLQCTAVTHDSNGTITKIKGTDILLDGKDISSILRNEKSGQNKDIQISWFGNYPICVSWNTTTGACSKTEDSHPFAIRSNSSLNYSDYKLHLGNLLKKSRTLGYYYFLWTPRELYNISASNNPGEIESDKSNSRNLCLSTLLMDPTTEAPVNCCQSEKCITYDNCKCGSDSISDVSWDNLYGPIVQELWKKASEYDKQVRPWVYSIQ